MNRTPYRTPKYAYPKGLLNPPILIEKQLGSKKMNKTPHVTHRQNHFKKLNTSPRAGCRPLWPINLGDLGVRSFKKRSTRLWKSKLKITKSLNTKKGVIQLIDSRYWLPTHNKPNDPRPRSWAFLLILSCVKNYQFSNRDSKRMLLIF